ncbi:hypothetical protein EVAR_17648_1 [Eumeta japonica]|uniref:Uncharacterized protein n=1 Tax=Eumeta variegata TaxID=151549 RepID=A0A4C1USZ5_EUMVA|nr:hypothetical protein EVAR_17648_1 [Eumeta japonica]
MLPEKPPVASAADTRPPAAARGSAGFEISFQQPPGRPSVIGAMRTGPTERRVERVFGVSLKHRDGELNLHTGRRPKQTGVAAVAARQAARRAPRGAVPYREPAGPHAVDAAEARDAFRIRITSYRMRTESTPYARSAVSACRVVARVTSRRVRLPRASRIPRPSGARTRVKTIVGLYGISAPCSRRGRNGSLPRN